MFTLHHILVFLGWSN